MKNNEQHYKELLELATNERRMLNDRIANVLRYDRELNKLEIPPNGDDYSAVLGLLNGADYRAPHVKGR